MHFILSGPHTSLPPSLIYETTKYRNTDKDKKKRWSIQCNAAGWQLAHWRVVSEPRYKHIHCTANAKRNFFLPFEGVKSKHYYLNICYSIKEWHIFKSQNWEIIIQQNVR